MSTKSLINSLLRTQITKAVLFNIFNWGLLKQNFFHNGWVVLLFQSRKLQRFGEVFLISASQHNDTRVEFKKLWNFYEAYYTPWYLMGDQELKIINP